MSKLASAFGKDFVKNKDKVRTRTFDLGGHTFKVKVPLTSEFEIMQERMKVVDDEKVEKYYKEITKDLEKYREKPDADLKCEFLENDIVIDGRSMREAAKNKIIAENRITEMFKLLVPEEKDFDMETITYAMVEELFPFAIQMQVVEMIGKVVSPNYETQKGK
jgi:ribosomal protein S17E